MCDILSIKRRVKIFDSKILHIIKYGPFFLKLQCWAYIKTVFPCTISQHRLYYITVHIRSQFECYFNYWLYLPYIKHMYTIYWCYMMNSSNIIFLLFLQCGTRGSRRYHPWSQTGHREGSSSNKGGESCWLYIENTLYLSDTICVSGFCIACLGNVLWYMIYPRKKIQHYTCNLFC